MESAISAKRKPNTSHGVVALVCDRCASGYLDLPWRKHIAEPMSNEQLDAVKDQLLSEDNNDLRQSVFSAYLEEPERGASMIIAFAADKGLKLDATPSEVVDYVDNPDDNDIDIEMTPEMLTSIAGGGKYCHCHEEAHDEPWGRCPGMRPMSKWLFGRQLVSQS